MKAGKISMLAALPEPCLSLECVALISVALNEAAYSWDGGLF